MAPTRWQPRVQSPQDEDFHTGQSDFNPDEALHSTAQFNAEQRQWAVRYGAKREHDVQSAGDLSDDQSIEIGRGLKRPLPDYRDLDSSQIVFTFGNDSQYEMTGTPTTHNNLAARGDYTSRKTSTTRRANESAKRSVSQNARVLSNLSEKIRLQAARANVQEWDDEEQLTATLSAKNTRFGHARASNPASQQHRVPSTQRRQLSTFDAAESFQLPDISGIEELVQGPLSKPKPVPLRAAIARARSRPAATPHNRAGRNDPPTERIPVQSVPVPEDEKQIYSSLQHLRDRIAQLESEKASAWSQLDRYENEVVELRSALLREEQLRRPDSALGSDEETEKEKWRLERTRLQATVRSLRQQLDRGDRKTQQSTTVLDKITTERDNLITQLGVECFRLSKAEAEIEHLKSEQVILLQQNNDLHHELSALREELAAAKGRTQQRRRSSSVGKPRRPSSNRQPDVDRNERPEKHSQATQQPQQHTYVTSLDNEARQSIAAAVQQQFDRLTLNARSTVSQHKPANTSAPRPTSHQTSLFPGPLGIDEHNATRTMTEFDLTNTRSIPFAPAGEHAGDDMTELTQNEPIIADGLRQTLDRIRQESHKRRPSSAQAVAEAVTAEQDRPANIARKSSFKSANAGRDATQATDDAPKAARVVRVQSPTASDQIEHAEGFDNGETSDLLIPDITLHRISTSGQAQDLCIQHDDNACTVCKSQASRQRQETIIPVLEFASARTDLPEDATLRPSQPSYDALVKVLKQLKDESVHLHLALRNLETQYHARDPSVGASARRALCDKMDQLRADCDRKDGQIYSLHDALEVHKHEQQQQQQRHAANAQQGGKSARCASSTGNAPAVNRESCSVKESDMAGSTARSAPPMGLDGAYDDESELGSIGLPEWDGLSEGGL